MLPLTNRLKIKTAWTTGNEPMTGAQKSYLKTLSDEAGEALNENLTKAEASKHIEELQHKTGRGLDKKVGAGARGDDRRAHRPAFARLVHGPVRR